MFTSVRLCAVVGGGARDPVIYGTRHRFLVALAAYSCKR
jgi:hypothetical protein